VAEDVYATLSTTAGDIRIKLFPNHAPKTVANFVELAEGGREWIDPRSGGRTKDPLYNGTVFHRVIDNFMIQGGGFNKDMSQKPTQAPIKNEANNGLKNENYTVAMARTGVRDSATSQFFINIKDNDFLNYSGESPQQWGYAVFGKVVEGKETVDKIKKVPTGNAMGHQNVPTQAVVIEKAECI